MKFQNRLTEHPESVRARCEDPSHGFRMLQALKAGRYSVSIQGSHGHYCTPRRLVPVEEYSSMEIAIFGRYSKTGNFLNVNRSSKLRAFPRLAELLERADGPQPTVFGYVPVDLIQDLLNYMES